MKADLHAHTFYSDGVYSPKELIEIAVSQKVDCFALTDHDSVFGCDEIQKYAKDYPIHVISGMELSTVFNNHSCHIVCLFPNNVVPQELIDFSYQMKEHRKQRAIQMMQRIHDIYHLKVDIDALIAENEIITRANMFYQIAKLNHMTQKEAEQYADTSSKAYIPSTKMSTAEGIAFAKSCGCLTILAHPCLLPKEDVEEIVKLCVEGIEVRYPKNKLGDEEFFSSLALKYHLYPSAGSDFHGDKGTKHAMIGTCTIEQDLLYPILERLGIQWK